MVLAAEVDPAEPPKARRVQMNVRLPEALVAAIDERREVKGLSRDKWVERALMFALSQGPRRPSLAPGQRRSGPRPAR